MPRVLIGHDRAQRPVYVTAASLPELHRVLEVSKEHLCETMHLPIQPGVLSGGPGVRWPMLYAHIMRSVQSRGAIRSVA